MEMCIRDSIGIELQGAAELPVGVKPVGAGGEGEEAKRSEKADVNTAGGEYFPRCV